MNAAGKRLGTGYLALVAIVFPGLWYLSRSGSWTDVIVALIGMFFIACLIEVWAK